VRSGTNDSESLHNVLLQSREGILLTYARLLVERSGGEDVIDAPIASEKGVVSKRARLRAALRPPFLDGDFVGPIARMKVRLMGIRAWWAGLDRGGSGAKGSFGLRLKDPEDQDHESEMHLSPMERIRKRYLFLRDQGRAAFQTQQDVVDDEQD
jgi:hypothetical protein